jgi:hypothetical protein
MTLTDRHIEALKKAAADIEFGSVTIEAGTGNHIDLIIHRRIRLPKEPEQPAQRRPLVVRKT